MRFGRVLLTVTLVMPSLVSAQVPSSGATTRVDGRKVFEQYKCLLCHSLEGKGGKLSVALDGVAERRDAAAMRRILLNPERELADSTAKVKMPTFPFKDGELDALVDYLLTLKKSGK